MLISGGVAGPQWTDTIRLKAYILGPCWIQFYVCVTIKPKQGLNMIIFDMAPQREPMFWV